MIRVTAKPEPAIFHARVREPGRAYLATNPHPTSNEFRSRDYWTRVLAELHNAYGGICSYSCHWIPYDTGADTVEHYVPKVHFPSQAYEWANYRLVCATLNGRKGTGTVLDPFTVDDDWFTLQFPSLLVKPAAGLASDDRLLVTSTCKLLGLNDEGTCLKARIRYAEKYCKQQITFEFLRDEAPFVAREIERQGLVGSLNDIMGYA